MGGDGATGDLHKLRLTKRTQSTSTQGRAGGCRKKEKDTHRNRSAPTSSFRQGVPESSARDGENSMGLRLPPILFVRRS